MSHESKILRKKIRSCEERIKAAISNPMRFTEWGNSHMMDVVNRAKVECEAYRGVLYEMNSDEIIYDKLMGFGFVKEDGLYELIERCKGLDLESMTNEVMKDYPEGCTAGAIAGALFILL